MIPRLPPIPATGPAPTTTLAVSFRVAGRPVMGDVTITHRDPRCIRRHVRDFVFGLRFNARCVTGAARPITDIKWHVEVRR